MDYWNPQKYVISWLKADHHGALDKPTGPTKQLQDVTCASKLFVADYSLNCELVLCFAWFDVFLSL
jgi:hypothetical protein